MRDRVYGGMCNAQLFPMPPTIDFRSSLNCCPDCGGALQVQKTCRRQVVTMHVGHFVARETVLHCPACSKGPIHSEELTSLVAPGANFGHDVMVHVGTARFLNYRSEEEIVAELMNHNVRLSISEVRNLSQRFAACLGIAHKQTGPAIAAHLASNGGYILHLDSTSRLNSRKIMSGIDEVSGLVLLNVRLSSETAADVAAFLRAVIADYGVPLAVASDMAASIRSAIGEVKELDGVPHFICHFHFLRDAGKDLLQDEYRQFEKRLESHGTQGVLNDLRRSAESQLGDQSEMIDVFIDVIADNSGAAPPRLDASTVAVLLAESALQSKRQTDGYGFPFERPAITYYEHLLRIGKAVEALASRDDLTTKEERLLGRIIVPLKAVARDRKLAKMADDLHRRAGVFDELRELMHLAPAGAGEGLKRAGAGQDVSITNMEATVRSFRYALDTDKFEMLKLQEQLDRHWLGLFHAPIAVTDPLGEECTIHPQRTNNLLEHFFRKLTHAERKKTGVELSAPRFDSIPVDSLFACNLNDPTYRTLLLDEAEDLAERFSRLDPQQIRRRIEEGRKSGSPFASPRKAGKTLATPWAPLRIAVQELTQQIEILQQ